MQNLNQSNQTTPAAQPEIIEPMTMRDLLKMIAQRQADADLLGLWNKRSFTRLGVPGDLWNKAQQDGLIKVTDGSAENLVRVKLAASGWIELHALSRAQ